MNDHNPSLSVDVDVTNPGQFFACLGLLELAHRLWAGAEGWFDQGTFFIRSSDPEASAAAILQEVGMCQCEPLDGSADPKIPPIRFGRPFNLRMDWWIDDRGKKTALGKMFAGQKRTLKDVKRLQDEIAKLIQTHTYDADLFGPNWAVPLPGRFGVDPRAAWEALDAGFSPNDQGMEVVTYLVVELLGAIGLQVSPPLLRDRSYVYAAWSAPLPACVSRAAATGLIQTAGPRSYRFQLAKRGSYKGFDFAIPIGDIS